MEKRKCGTKEKKEVLDMLPNLRDQGLTRLMDEFFGKDLANDVMSNQRGVNVPAVNVKETEQDYKIEVAAPGLEKDDFDVNIDNGVLTVSSEKEHKDEDKQDDYVRREFSYTSFQRSFTLPDSVDEEGIKASHDKGVLTISLPKKEEEKKKETKRIEIQ